MKFYRTPDGEGGSFPASEEHSRKLNEEINQPLAKPDSEETDSAGLTGLDHRIAEERFSDDNRKRILEFRKQIDSFFLTASALQKSRAISLAITSFEFARQWTGVVLAERGARNPYPESSNPKSDKIEERADKGELLMDVLEHDTEIAIVKHLRSYVADLVTELIVYIETTTPTGPMEFVAMNSVLQRVVEGKMSLGERLGEIRAGQGL